MYRDEYALIEKHSKNLQHDQDQQYKDLGIFPANGDDSAREGWVKMPKDPVQEAHKLDESEGVFDQSVEHSLKNHPLINAGK